MGNRTALIEEVYSLLSAGDVEKAISHVTEDAKWHVPGLGVEVEGREKVLEFTRGLYSRGFHQHVLHSAEYGDVVACWIEGTLPDGANYKSCVVHRFEGDKIAEYTSVRV